MPRIKVNLMVEFEADKVGSDQDIDLALDQVLLLQPSCKLVSKRVAEIDGEVVGGGAGCSLLDPISRRATHASTALWNGFHGDSYRPDYPHHDRDRDRDTGSRFDSYRPAPVSLDVDARSFRAVDSYRPKDHLSSDSAAMHPDRQKALSFPVLPELVDNNGELPPIGYEKFDPQQAQAIGLGTRYDTLIEDMVFPPGDPQSPRPKKKNRHGNRGAHYSPPPRPDRSASPSSSGNALRRSDRLRGDAPGTSRAKEIVWPPGRRSRDLIPDARREGSSEEALENRLVSLSRKRDEDLKTMDAEPGSLEALASTVVAKDAVGPKNKFEKQWERHGITEALRLRSLRSNHKIEKSKHRFDRKRWGDGEVKQGARMDAVIDQIASFDFGSPSGPSTATNGRNGNDGINPAESSHPPVETRKKKSGGGGGGKARERSGGVARGEAGMGMDDDDMQDMSLNPSQEQGQGQEQDLDSASANAMAMAVDEAGRHGDSGNRAAATTGSNAVPMAPNQTQQNQS